MRVALVSPYSWTYPGGVTRHIEALARRAARRRPRRARARAVRPRRPPHGAGRTAARGRSSAPCPSGWSRSARRWAGPRTAPSRTSPHTPTAIARLRRELRAGRFDVVHVHEPVTPVVGWDALISTDAPLVGTFHCYSESRLAARRRQPDGRAPQAQPPHRADRRLRGRGLDRQALLRRRVPDRPQRRRRCPRAACPRRALRAPGEPLEIAFVGQAVERKGLPVLLRAFEALREHVPGAADDRRRLGARGRAAARRARRA